MKNPNNLFAQLQRFFSTGVISLSFFRKWQYLLAIALFFNAQVIYALLPNDHTVIHGSVNVDTVGNHMTITSSPDTILDWQSFSIGSGDSVEFLMPNSSDQILNRVIGSNSSQIFGELTSNGTVWLINPHGILFGQNAQINVGGLVASTLEITNVDFLANRYHFNATNDVSGDVINQGKIKTSLGGRVWLTGVQVSNEGSIETPNGSIILAAAKNVDLIDSRAPNVVVRVNLPENEASNLGSLIARNGVVDVYGSIVNQDGLINVNQIDIDESGRVFLTASDTLTHAKNANTQGSDVNIYSDHDVHLYGEVDASNLHSSGGHIRVDGKDSVEFGASLLATGKTQGGRLEVTGKMIEFLGAAIDASGGKKGGSINLGGWTGNDNLTLASNITIDQSSVVKANGVEQGGKIAVASSQSTEFYSFLEAVNGGHVELTSQGSLIHQGSILTGLNGHVLFGAKQFFISCGCSPVPAESSQLLNSFIDNQLIESTNVTIRAINDIVVNDPFFENTVHTGNLILDAGHDIQLQTQIDLNNQNLSMQAGHDIIVDEPIFNISKNSSSQNTSLALDAVNDIQLQAVINLDNQNLRLSAGDTVTVNEFIHTNGENLTILAGRDILVGADINTQDGDLVAIAGNSGSINTTPVLQIQEGYSLDVGSGTAILAAQNGIFINQNGDSAILTSGSGRWLIYSAHPDSTTEGFSKFINGVQQYNKHYSQRYTGFIPSYANQGNWFLYSVEPFLQVTPDHATITYGQSLANIDSTVSDSGLIDNDTLADARITGNEAWNVDGTKSTSGNPTVGVHDLIYASGLVSALGYQFEDNPLSINELTVNQAPLALTDLTISDKIYDTTPQTSLLPGSEVFDGLVPNDKVVVTQVDALFEDPNVGSAKLVTVSGAEIGGVDAMNYIFDETVAMTEQASILPAKLILQADSVTSSPGLPGLKLKGTVDGFLGNDTLENATSGSLKWTTTATKKSPVGTYSVEGGGIIATNYQIIQADNNVSALIIEQGKSTTSSNDGINDHKNSITDPIPTDPAGPPPTIVVEYKRPVWEIFHELGKKLESSGQMAYAALLAKLSVNAIHMQPSSKHLLEKIKAHEFLVRLLLEQERYIEARFDALPMLKKLEYTYFINNEYEESFPAQVPYNSVEMNYANMVYDYITGVISDTEDEWFDEYTQNFPNELYESKSNFASTQPKNYYIKLAASDIDKTIMTDSGGGIVIAENAITQRGQSLFDGALDLGAESSDDIQFQVDAIVARIHIDEIGHIDDIEAELKNSGHFLNEIERRGRVQEGLRRLERNLNEKTVLLFYILFEEKLTLLLYSASAFLPDMILDISLNRTELNHQVAQFRQKLINPHSNDYLISGEFLFNSLVAPISSRLKELEPDTIAIYKTGSLRYLPFSALYDGNKYLIEDYAITTYFEAELAYLERPDDNWSIAGFGVSESVLGDLPAVVDELNQIVLDVSNNENKLKHEAGILQGRKYLNESFTSEILQDAIANEDLSILHFASHFVLGDNYEDSYLLAGDGAQITLKEFRNFQMMGKQLVTLSACETALDSKVITANDGREVEGLGFTVFTKNNAKSVLATLWKVADQSTADFMVEFYRLIKQSKHSKVEAIRQSQLSFIKGVDSDGEDIGKRFQHPYYWSPFILMGNWL